MVVHPWSESVDQSAEEGRISELEIKSSVDLTEEG